MQRAIPVVIQVRGRDEIQRNALRTTTVGSVESNTTPSFSPAGNKVPSLDHKRRSSAAIMSERLAAYAVEVANALRGVAYPSQVISEPDVTGWYLRNEMSFREQRYSVSYATKLIKEENFWEQLILATNGSLYSRHIRFRIMDFNPPIPEWEHRPLTELVSSVSRSDLDFQYERRPFSRDHGYVRVIGWVLKPIRRLHQEPGEGIGIALARLRRSGTGS
jgi:hypothetical protein